jgi:hypothetical protein
MRMRLSCAFYFAARAFPASSQLSIIEANNSASNAFDPP